jgi:hypothetical protein
MPELTHEERMAVIVLLLRDLAISEEEEFNNLIRSAIDKLASDANLPEGAIQSEIVKRAIKKGKIKK